MKHSILLLFLLAISFAAKLQEPAHFFLGENELSGLLIYDLYQDKKKNYWIATNSGIYRYDCYQFEKFECSEMLSPSVFNLSEDLEGNIYCNNLGGQVFQVKNDTCKLFFEVPDSLLSTNIIMEFSGNDMLIAAKKVLRIDRDQNLTVLSDYLFSFVEIIVTENEHIVGLGLANNEVIQIDYENGELETTLLHYPEKAMRSSYLFPIYFKQQIYAMNRANGQLFNIRNDSLIPDRLSPFDETHYRTYSVNDQFWMPTGTNGIYFLDESFTLQTKDPIFNSQKVSAILADHEDNILLGTFNNGIIVIPKTHVTDVNTGDYKGKINQLSLINGEQAAIGTSDGEVCLLQKSEEPILLRSEPYQIELLEYFENQNSIFVGAQSAFFYNLEQEQKIPVFTNTAKDISLLPNQQYLIASNINVSINSLNGEVLNPLNPSDPPSKNQITIYHGRSYCALYDPSNTVIYMATSIGLKMADKNGVQDIMRNDEELFCSDMVYLDGKVYAVHLNKGLLILENGKITDYWSTANHLISSEVKYIKTDGKRLFLSTDKGIQILMPNGKTDGVLNRSEGLYTDKILDFEVKDDALWVLHQQGVQHINLAEFKIEEFVPEIELKSIYINDSLAAIDPNSQVKLNHHQNRITFQLSSISLKHKNEIQYAYHISGVDPDWQYNSYDNNLVSYKTLPPGDYTFKVKAVCGSKSSEEITFSFSISKPFWETLWFYVLIAIICISTLLLIFRNEIRKQKKKAALQKELYNSKLTAIQAQMNPHFIFNSLNSIQDLVLRNDAENAYIYISKFALLVRSTLNHSNQDFIELREELESLELYLTLEKLRFKDAFDFKITTDFHEDIQIPPLLIQPFIENSLIHGLMHKDGYKLLEVNFSLEDSLICTITDNGIGRTEAKKIRDRQRLNHESFAVEAIKRRLEILELHYGGTFEIIYKDLIEDDIPSGTQVQVHIPYQKNY